MTRSTARFLACGVMLYSLRAREAFSLNIFSSADALARGNVEPVGA